LDEPTTGLDPAYARQIKDLIQRQRQAGKTIFLTTHDMTVAGELCDRLAFIVDGQLSLIDSPKSLKLKHGVAEVKVEYERDGRTEVEAFPLEGLAENERFLNCLRQRVETIHSQEATLERIFIEITGRGLL
jgi:fluoroquinolone transport system ATP-binding protein